MHSSPLNPPKPFLKRKVSQIIMACVFRHGIVVNAFRSKGLDPKTVRWHRLIRHALLSNYGLVIAQDSFVSRKHRRISRDQLLSPTFPKTRLKVKYIKDLCRARIQTMTCVKWGLQHRASQIRLESHERTARRTRLGLKRPWSPCSAFLNTQSLETHLEAKRVTKYHKMCLSA